MKTIFQAARDLLERREPFVLATIVSHSGSTPRTAGSKMIITADGRGIGTIGGGLLEARAMSLAVELIAQGASAVMPVDLSYQAVSTMDMICGGQAEVLLDCVKATENDRDVFGRWSQLLAAGRNGCLLTQVTMADGTVTKVAHGLANARGEIEAGLLTLTAMASDQVAAAIASPEIRTLAVDGGFLVLEPAIRSCAAFIFGAGHVAQPTAHLAAMVGFRVSVADDRAEYANRERFPEADEVRILEDFGHSLPAGGLGRDDYVIIVTRGHLHDKTVLAQALNTGAGYIGMIGSRRKRDAIYEMLRMEGHTQADIDRVHSPIGLAIAAETPEEIAVSIVGEMIQHRAAAK